MNVWGHLFVVLTVAAASATALPAAAARPKPPPSHPLAGTVTHVEDGDTLVFTPSGQAAVVVRLRDIDAPEPCQAGGSESRRALAELTLNKPALLRAGSHDAAGRTVGAVTVDDVDVGVRMVEEGQAWSLRTRYDQGPLVKQERMARALSRGLHAGADRVAPWEFRKAHGPCRDGEAAPAAPPVAPAASDHRRAPAAGAAYRCDGRVRCTQMRSCDEARFFLANCPGVQMDGDRNGIPCERQWCVGTAAHREGDVDDGRDRGRGGRGRRR